MNKFLLLFTLIISSYSATIYSANTQFICLVVSTENDEKVIESCLRSAKDIADCMLLYDKGSSDNTLKVADEFIKNSGMRGRVCQGNTDWSDARIDSIQAAQDYITDLQVPLSNTYLLFLDPDTFLNENSGFKKEALSNEAYLILHRSGDLYFYHPGLVQASIPADKIIQIIEKQPYKKPFPYKKLLGLSVHDLLDNPYKTDRLMGKIEQLKAILQEDPQHSDSLLALALVHKSLKKYDEALDLYQSFINNNDDKELAWLSSCMTAECYENLKQWEPAMQWYLHALQQAPDRSEPMKKIATHYRNTKQHEIAYVFAKHGSTLKASEGHYLFTLDPRDTHQLDEELSIISYYAHRPVEGLAATNRLIMDKNVSDASKKLAYENMLYYVDNLQNGKMKPISIELPALLPGSSLTYNLMNSSIKKSGEGYKMICRTVNYKQHGGYRYKTKDPSEKTIQTKNFMVEFDKDLNVVAQNEIIEDLPRIKTHYRVIPGVEGLEDCRQIHGENENWFTCTTYDTNPTGYLQMTLCKLSDDLHDNTYRVEKFVPIKGPSPIRHEKNWMPFTLNNEIHAIYSYDPLIVYKIDQESGECEKTHNIMPKQDFSHFRGSAGPIEFEDGYLVLVHEVVFTHQRNYMHRFVFFDKDFVAKKASKPFTFMHKGVEFCCGMTLDHSGKNLILSVSIEDREAHCCTVDVGTVHRLLEPLQ